MNRILKIAFQFLTLSGLILLFCNLSAFAGSLPATGQDIFQSSQIPAPPPDQSGQSIVVDLVFGGLRYVKIIVAVIGILYITIMGYALITSSDQEEKVTEARKGIVYTLIAFLMISMSQDIGRIFDQTGGGLLGSPQNILSKVRLFDKQIEIFVTFIKYLIAAYATLMVLRSGIKMVTAGGKEEETTKHKKALMYSAGGLALITVGDIFINKVFYKVNKSVYSGITGVHPQVDVKAGVEEIVGITNFVVSFVAPIAVLVLIVGAIMYATSAGEDDRMDKAKRILVSAAIGIVIIYGAFALVSTVIAGRLQDIGSILN